MQERMEENLECCMYGIGHKGENGDTSSIWTPVLTLSG
jgi:hypothetical protein